MASERARDGRSGEQPEGGAVARSAEGRSGEFRWQGRRGCRGSSLRVCGAGGGGGEAGEARFAALPPFRPRFPFLPQKPPLPAADSSAELLRSPVPLGRAALRNLARQTPAAPRNARPPATPVAASGAGFEAVLRTHIQFWAFCVLGQVAKRIHSRSPRLLDTKEQQKTPRWD